MPKGVAGGTNLSPLLLRIPPSHVESGQYKMGHFNAQFSRLVAQRRLTAVLLHSARCPVILRPGLRIFILYPEAAWDSELSRPAKG